jgi:hypothetical protein
MFLDFRLIKFLLVSVALLFATLQEQVRFGPYQVNIFGIFKGEQYLEDRHDRTDIRIVAEIYFVHGINPSQDIFILKERLLTIHS